MLQWRALVNGNEIMGRIKRDDFLDQLSDYQLLEGDLLHDLDYRKKFQKYIQLRTGILVQLK
jgi:hypothetical protein